MTQGNPNRPRKDPEIDLDLLHDSDAEPAAPAAVTVMHHVYSSANGYRTLIFSPRLQPLMPRLEEWAKKQCTSANTGTRWFSFPLDDAHWTISKAFKAGVDRAGRPRNCVHSVVFDRSELWARWPEFNPTRIPSDWFLAANAKLDESALKEQLRDSLTPTSRPELARGRGIKPFSPQEGAFVQALLYAPQGIFAIKRDGLPPETLSELFDWLPFAYRLRWAMGSEPMADFPRQVLLGELPTTLPSHAPPILGTGWPSAVAEPDYETGVWDHWLFRPDAQSPASFRHFHRWMAQLNLSHAPTPDEENWMLAAFQCLRPFEPIDQAITDVNATRTPQVVLGVLCLGWGNQPGAAVAKMAEFGHALIARRRFNALAHLIEQTWQATYHRPGPMPFSDHARQRLNAKLEAIAQHANAHAQVMQTVWSLFSSTRVIGFSAYQAHQLPLPDLRRGATLWQTDRRSLLWMNLVLLANQAIQQMTQIGHSLLASDEQRDAVKRLANQLATFCKYRELFVHAHQWLFAEMSGPTGTPAQAIRLLDILLQNAYPPDEINPIKDRLRRFGHP